MKTITLNFDLCTECPFISCYRQDPQFMTTGAVCTKTHSILSWDINKASPLKIPDWCPLEDYENNG